MQKTTNGRSVTHHAGPRLARGLPGRFIVLLTAGVLLAACGNAGSAVDSEAGRAAGNGDFPIDMYRGGEIVGGDEIDFSEILRMGKPVVLNFWAGLCPPCRAEMPSLQQVYDEYGDDFILIGVDVGPFTGLGSPADALRLLEELDITYPTGQALSSRTVRELNILQMPTTIYYDADGNEFSRHPGFITEGQLRDQVQELLNAAP